LEGCNADNAGPGLRGGGGYIKRASIIMRGGPVPTSPERFWIGLG
jgi:hypothetical protein